MKKFIKKLDKNIFYVWYDMESCAPIEIYFKLPTPYIFSFYINYNENSLNLYDENDYCIKIFQMPQTITEFMQIYDEIMNNYKKGRK